MSYPKGKTSVTCYAYEPWHFRYVGRAVAAKIHASGLTPREYLWRQQTTPRPDTDPDPHADADPGGRVPTSRSAAPDAGHRTDPPVTEPTPPVEADAGDRPDPAGRADAAPSRRPVVDPTPTT